MSLMATGRTRQELRDLRLGVLLVVVSDMLLSLAVYFLWR